MPGAFLTDRLRQPMRLRDLLTNRDLNHAVIRALAAIIDEMAGTVAPKDQQRALEIVERVLGPEHPTTWGIQGNLEALLRERGDAG